MLFRSEAFAKLDKALLDDLLKPENKDTLVAILTYHVVPGKVTAADVVKLTSAKTVQGEEITIKVDGNTVMVNDAKVTQTDIAASNGVIHVIDTVILPPRWPRSSPRRRRTSWKLQLLPATSRRWRQRWRRPAWWRR